LSLRGTAMRILVVDDSSTMRRIIINTLNKLGYKDCQEAGNGREGVARLEAGPVDMIITDWNMPEMSGVEFIRAVRANDATKKLPVLMVTTNASEDDIVEALRAGVNNYVVKPFTPDTIKEKIEAALKS
jgi:two-component system, chemotaxis family, chemotaxis protein CheY